MKTQSRISIVYTLETKTRQSGSRIKRVYFCANLSEELREFFFHVENLSLADFRLHFAKPIWII